MRNRGSDRKGMFLSRNETRQSQMVKPGKCSRLIHEQKDGIEAALSRCQMTISELAFELGLSNDTIRNRINEMLVEGRCACRGLACPGYDDGADLGRRF